MKILWFSDSPEAFTGYGIVTKNIVERLVKLGYDINCGGFFTGSKEIKQKDGYKIYCMERYSIDDIKRIINLVKPDIVVSLNDLLLVKDFRNLDIKWIGYFPLSGEPIPEIYREILDKMYKRITMCKYAENLVKKFGLDCEMIYHGVDLNMFKPLDKELIKKKYGFEGKFVIGSVCRNQIRKMHPRLLKAFKDFSSDKDDVILYLHTTLNSSDGHDLVELCKRYGIFDKVKFSNKKTLSSGYEFGKMNEIYNLFDIHCLATAGEGFGLPIIESMACGVPNIVTDCSACTELVSGKGEVVKPVTFTMSNLNVNRFLVDIKEFSEKLNLLYKDANLRREYSKKGLEFVKKLDWDLIVKEFDRVLKDC